MSEYNNLQEKSACFVPSDKYADNCIRTVEEFDQWFSYWERFNKNRKYKVYFRGMGEAKHKLFSSSQRIWLNEKEHWKRKNPQLRYQDFVMDLINGALTSHALLDNVFDLYGIIGLHKEFPCMSILQHYGSPTPLLDWSYNFNVALFFATESTTVPDANAANELDNYFAIYVITEETYLIPEIEAREGVASCFPLPTEPVHPGQLLRLTDIKLENELFKPDDPFKKVLMATIYNQNIIPQEGLFIFNPHAEVPLEDLFNDQYRSAIPMDETNVPNSTFIVYNIRKSLTEHVKKKIAVQGYTQDYIMPDLRAYVSSVKEKVLKGLQ